MLTARQKDLLSLIEESIRADGTAPSFEEMKSSLGLTSKSGVHRLLSSLEERGFIRRIPNRARAIEVIRTHSSFRGEQIDRSAAIEAARVLSIHVLEAILSEKKLAA